MRITPNLRARIRAHACHWVGLPELTVPSAAVDDEQTDAWSKSMYDKDLADERKPYTGEAETTGVAEQGIRIVHRARVYAATIPAPVFPVVGMRPRTLRRNLGLAFLGAILAGCVLGTGIARADTSLDDYVAVNGPVVCSLLDSEPTVAGVEHVGMALYGKGLTAQQAGEVLVRSVVGLCPRHLPELNSFIAKWNHAETVHA
jgi:hypothetical protein